MWERVFRGREGNFKLIGVPVPDGFLPRDKWLMSSKKAEDYYNTVPEGDLERRKIMKVMGAAQDQNDSSFRLLTLLKHAFWFQQQGGMPVAVRPRIPESVKTEQLYIARHLVREMRRFCNEREIHFAVYEVDSGTRKPVDHSPIQHLVEQEKIDFIASRHRFYRESRGTRKFCYNYDLHWNEAGHHLVGTNVSDYLVSTSVLNAPKGVPGSPSGR